MSSNVFNYAQRYNTLGGLSVVPIRTDKSKRPTVDWEKYQHHKMDIDEVTHYFGSNGVGVGIICGKVSGGLEVLDFDVKHCDVYGKWCQAVMATGGKDLLKRLVSVYTPSGGHHVYFRSSVPAGNTKLARVSVTDSNGQKKILDLIETRGEGGYVLAPGSPAACHEANSEYQIVQGDLLKIPVVTEEERSLLIETAKEFNEYIEPPKKYVTGTTENGIDSQRPGDDFNKRASWNEVLTPHGWRSESERNGETRWIRPGGERPSAVSNHFGNDELVVFSTNAAPFEAGFGYSKFAAYALLNHNGDFSDAAKELAIEGYGQKQNDHQSKSKSAVPHLKDIQINEPATHKHSSWEDAAKILAPIEWDWYGWIPKGFTGLIASVSGEGKSAVMLACSEPYLLGSDWPDGSKYEGVIGEVVWAEAEAAQAINVDRAKKRGLPINRIISPFENPLMDFQLGLPEHREAFVSAMSRPSVRFGIIDSLSGANTGKGRKKESSEEMLEHGKFLAELSRDLHKPIKIIHHFRKRNENDTEITLEMVRGSSAIAQNTRIVWAIDKPDPNSERKRLKVIKSNLARFPNPIGFLITENGIEFGSAPVPPRKESKIDRAIDFLLILLKNGPKAFR